VDREAACRADSEAFDRAPLEQAEWRTFAQFHLSAVLDKEPSSLALGTSLLDHVFLGRLPELPRGDPGNPKLAPDLAT
jgi:hypothetical protein